MRQKDLFTVTVSAGGQTSRVGYRGIAECVRDPGLVTLLDQPGAVADLHVGSLKLTGRPAVSHRELVEVLVSHARTILRQLL